MTDEVDERSVGWSLKKGIVISFLLGGGSGDQMEIFPSKGGIIKIFS